MAYRYTDFQLLCHSLPENWSLFLGGGRGGAKSTWMAQSIGITCERHRADARILFLRQGPYKALNDFTETLHQYLTKLWGPRAHSLNKSDHVWTTPTGTYLELGILPAGKEGLKYYEKTYQGRSFTHIYGDEAQQWADPAPLDLLVSNLRGSIPTRLVLGANPGGIGHQWLAQRFAFNPAGPWRPFDITKSVTMLDGSKIETSRTWVSCPSTFRDNPNNGPEYLTNLAAACGHDLELLAAWVSGSWNISRGAYFAAALDNDWIRFNWPEPELWDGWRPYDWQFWLAFDHGTSAPAACYVMARSPGGVGPDGRYYSAGSILALDEWVCHRPGDLSAGFGWLIPKIASHVVALARRWNIPATGVADDACFGGDGHAAGTIADGYADEGVHFRPAHKGTRAPALLKMKQMLASCGNNERPGLYVSRRCEYFWATVPFLVHDPRDPEVFEKCGTDHGADAVRYGLNGPTSLGGVVPL